MPSIRNPQAEAAELLGPNRVGVVLEHDGEDSWAAAAQHDPTLSTFARDHWLADLKRLEQAPPTLAATRRSLTALAFYVISPARQKANGKIGLRWTKGGFGTPFFDDDRQIRVEGDLLVAQGRDSVDSRPISTLGAAGEFVGVAPGAPTGIDFHDAPPPIDDDLALDVDPQAVAFLDDWFGFATHVLERLHFRAGSPEDTRMQLWSEHFDPAIELGEAEAGSRASFGASPGDDTMIDPYLYVSPWSKHEGDFWSAPFEGAALTLGALREAADQVAAALSFFEQARSLLGTP